MALLALAVLALGPSAAHGQDADTLYLTLDESIRLAEGGNPAYRQAENTGSLNAVESRATWLGQLLPRASLTLFNTAFTGNLRRRSVDFYGNPVENPNAEWVYFSTTSQGLNLSWTFQGRSLFDAHERLSLDNLGRDLGRDVALRGLRVDVQRRYLDALEQAELMRAEEERIEARRLDLEVAVRLHSLAMRTRVDVLNAELAVEQQVLAHRRQEAAYAQALLALRTVMGLEGPTPVALAEEPLPLFDPASLDVERLVLRASEANPALRRSTVEVRQAGLALSEQRNGWWPEVTMGFNIGRRAQGPSDGALFDMSFDEDLDQNFFLQLSLPVLDGFFDRRRNEQRAAVELENRREADRASRLQVEETVRSAHLELGNQWETLRLAERSHEIAGEALRLAREEYRLGTRTFEDLREAFEQEAETRRQVITARHAFVDALLDLEEAVGERIRPQVGPPGPGG